MRTTADVVVVGAGIIGCTTAYELAGRGMDVVLLERAEIAHGASGRNHGLVYYPQSPITDPLYQESFAIYREMAADAPADIWMDERPAGLVVLAANDEDWLLAETEAEVCRAGGVPVERWDRDRLGTEEPEVAPHYLGAWYIDDGYRLDPQALTLAFALKARQRGAEISTHTDVKQVVVSKGRVRGVVTDNGAIEAGIVVLAAGPWTAKLARKAGVEVRITGARGWLLLAHPERKLCNHLVESAGWHLMSGDPGLPDVTVEGYGAEKPLPADVGILLQPAPNGHLLIGGSRIASLRQDPEGPEVAQEIARRAAAAVPALAEAPLKEVWSGVRPMTPDGLPLIGWAGVLKGLFVAGGHGGQGVMLGAGTGRLVGQMIAGEETFTSPDPFSLDRAALQREDLGAGLSEGD